jgi:hypothetical protein
VSMSVAKMDKNTLYVICWEMSNARDTNFF